jgi:predicted transcriptional regulator
MSSDKTSSARNIPPPARDGKGRWRKGVESYERDAEACRMYVAGKTYQEIADELGYGSRGTAHTAVQKILMETAKQPADEVRSLLRARNEEIYAMAREIALRNHYAHGNGKLVYKDGEPLLDDGPKLNAMDRMQRALTELAKLAGAHAAVKFENLSLDVVQAEIARLEAEAREAGEDV